MRPVQLETNFAANGAGVFQTTQWNVVVTSGQTEDPGLARTALTELCESYWRPLYAYARRRGMERADAQDAVQSFLLDLIEHKTFALADPLRGRFRTFLLGIFQRFLASAWQRERTLRRGGRAQMIFLDAADAERVCHAELSSRATPERAYEMRWAMDTVARALGTLEGQARKAGRDSLFQTLKPFLDGEVAEASYAETATRLGLSLAALKTSIHRLRREFRETLRREVARTLADPCQVDEELDHLRSALAGAGH
jgi:RNA polymerase sigma-70 factor (ECF subfamily)